MTHKSVSDLWLHEGTAAFMQPEYTREVMGDAAYYARIYESYLRRETGGRSRGVQRVTNLVVLSGVDIAPHGQFITTGL